MPLFWNSLLAAGLAAPLAAWLTARFALHRFYREKVWERKTVAYTIIFEALYEMHRWFDEHYDALLKDRAISEEKSEELTRNYQKAQQDLKRKLAAESWLLPSACLQRLDKLNNDLKVDHGDWFMNLDNSWGDLNQAIQQMRDIVRADLGLSATPVRIWINSVSRDGQLMLRSVQKKLAGLKR